MLADSMMPEAYEHGGKLVGVVTTLGFETALRSTHRLSPHVRAAEPQVAAFDLIPSGRWRPGRRARG
jgi:hypothetical protein